MGIPAKDWAGTPASVRVVLLSLLPLIPLVDQVQHLQAEVAELRAQLRQHSRNSFQTAPARVTEYQLRALACPHCGEITRAVPPAGMPPRGYGPRVVAITNLLHARAKQSARDTAALTETLFGLLMADGTVTATEQVMSAALAPIYDHVQLVT